MLKSCSYYNSLVVSRFFGKFNSRKLCFYLARRQATRGATGSLRVKSAIITNNLFNKIIECNLNKCDNKVRQYSKSIVETTSTSTTSSGDIEDDADDLVELDVGHKSVSTIDDVDNFKNESIKYLLYLNDDKLLATINNCESIDEIFQLIKKNCDKLSQQQAVQCVLALCYFFRQNSAESNPRSAINLSNDEFSKLLDKIYEFTDLMTADELTVCFLYLNKMGVPMHHKLMNTILEKCLTLIRTEGNIIPLTALSRFTVAINSSRQFYTFLMCQDVLLQIFSNLDCLKDSEDLRLVTICLINLHQLISKDDLLVYKKKVSELYENGQLTEDTRCLLKIIQFLSYPHWSQDNTEMVRNIILLLKDKIDELQYKELDAIFKIFQTHLEPATIGPVITQQAHKLMEKIPTAELLACTVMYTLPERRTKLTEIAKDFIYSKTVTDNPGMLTTLFKVLRLLKISNTQICDGYWTRVLDEIKNNAHEQELYILLRHCHRYMYFNNNLGGTYRHYNFEKTIVKMLEADLETGISNVIPSKIAKIASFMFGYGHTRKTTHIFSEFIVRRIEDMSEQFSILDCLQITRGMEIAFQLRFGHYFSAELSNQLVRLENVLNACTERHLQQSNLSFTDLNQILRAFNNRRSSKKTQIYQKIMEKYEHVPSKLTSRLIRDITFNMNASNFHLPTICAGMMRYVQENKAYVMGDTVEKVLYCCYNLGYHTDNEEMLKSAAEIVQRDFNYMSGLSIVQACLALTFYKALPTSLISRVFDIEFIQRIEDEIQMCYSKATYPERVLNKVMQLNRAVCLDFPEASVPWFQQNYIEAQMSKLPKIKNNFKTDIHEMIATMAEDRNFVQVDYVTPYGYRIDFVLYFDKNRKIIAAPPLADEIVKNINKVAILLLKIDAFCQNNRQVLRGQEYLRQRHLEMLGYKVIQINYSEWTSMYMNVPGAKLNYLQNLLEISQ